MRKIYTVPRVLLSSLMILFSVFAFGQGATVEGIVRDANNEPVPGASVIIVGTTNGGSTNANGAYKILNVPSGTVKLAASFLGYRTAEATLTVLAGKSYKQDFVMQDDAKMLSEAVVVGYGEMQTRDLTGSVVAITSKTFQQGNIATPEQLILGKSAGVRVTSNGGAPGAGSSIRIRGGSSLNASNDPLIVIDGVPVDNRGIAGAANPLSLLNPDDIETFTVLKDASSAAIYGSRAANGVIIITTKKGRATDKLKIEVSNNTSVKTLANTIQVLNANEYRNLIAEKGTQDMKNLLAESPEGVNTDWQSEIFTPGLVNDLNMNFTGGLKKLPYRLGLEYYNEQGILRTGSMNRFGSTLNINPMLLDKSLKVDLNAKFYHTKNVFANQGAIGSAVAFDPTKPVRDENSVYGGYFEWLLNNGNPNANAPRNPVGLLNQRDDRSNVNRFLGNVLFDYELPSMKNLHLFLNLGADYSSGSGTIFVPAEAAFAFNQVDSLRGTNNIYEQTKRSQVLEAYFEYKKDLKKLRSNLNLVGGYSYQYWSEESPSFPGLSATNDTIPTAPAAPFPFFTDNALMSFYGRSVITIRERLLVTATLRADGSSRFSPETRWGYFPSVAAAYRLGELDMFKKYDKLSALKLRAAWGITGQQDIGSDYAYIPNYQQGTNTAQYQFGDQYFFFLRPDGYDANLKWETTSSYNFGIDFGFLNNRLNGSIDWYRKDTRDLLSVVPIPAGTNFTNRILTNVGNMTNQGIELNLSYIVIDNKNTTIELGGNLTFNRNELTKISLVDDSDIEGIRVGGISGAVGNTIQLHRPGSPIFSYYTFTQIYDENGKPIEGEYEDLNGDGIINDEDLSVFNGNPNPNYFIGFFGNVRHKKWNGGFSLRAELGQYVYNNVNSNNGTLNNISPNGPYLNNITTDYFNTNFERPQYQSDYYLEKANFLRLDNLFVGYNFGDIWKEKANLRVSLIAQNLFVITKYSGLDPEVFGGIDNNFYPRPRIFTLNVNLNF